MISDLSVQLARERLYIITAERRWAEQQRLRIQKKVDEMAVSTEAGRVAAAKARARDVHAQISALITHLKEQGCESQFTELRGKFEPDIRREVEQAHPEASMNEPPK